MKHIKTYEKIEEINNQLSNKYILLTKIIGNRIKMSNMDKLSNQLISEIGEIIQTKIKHNGEKLFIIKYNNITKYNGLFTFNQKDIKYVTANNKEKLNIILNAKKYNL